MIYLVGLIYSHVLVSKSRETFLAVVTEKDETKKESEIYDFLALMMEKEDHQPRNMGRIYKLENTRK